MGERAPGRNRCFVQPVQSSSCQGRVLASYTGSQHCYRMTRDQGSRAPFQEPGDGDGARVLGSHNPPRTGRKKKLGGILTALLRRASGQVGSRGGRWSWGEDADAVCAGQEDSSFVLIHTIGRAVRAGDRAQDSQPDSHETLAGERHRGIFPRCSSPCWMAKRGIRGAVSHFKAISPSGAFGSATVCWHPGRDSTYVSYLTALFRRRVSNRRRYGRRVHVQLQSGAGIWCCLVTSARDVIGDGWARCSCSG